MSASAVLETDRIAMSYPGTRALDGVSLSFPAGEVSALVGRNGAGKSTVVKILSGAVRPTEGDVRLDGAPVVLRSPAEARALGIATVHQELSLVPGLSAGENVLLGRFPRRRGLAGVAIDWRRLFEEAERILAGMDVALDVRAPVERLSLAKRQMIEIARAVSAGARAVLFDEPTAGLARAEVRTLFRLVRGLAGQGVAIVYVTHHLGELAEIADTVTALRDGRVAATIPGKDATSAALVAMMYGEDAAAHEAQAGAPTADIGTGFAATGARLPTSRVPAAPRTVVVPERGTPPAPVLEVAGLGVGDVLHDVSFALGPGEILGIAGMLGSGRTELLMALFGARRADRGSIRVRETTLSASRATPSRMRALGLALVPEDRKVQGLVPGLSALDNLCLANLSGVSWRGLVTSKRLLDAARPVAEELDLVAADLRAPVSVLSGGNQQKVVLGKWLMRKPRVLLCDEPARGIDVRAKAWMFDALRALSRRGIASIVVSSELEDVLEVAHRILVLRRGTIAAQVAPAEVTLDRLLGLCMGEDRGTGPVPTGPAGTAPFPETS